jgi:hypothetical protein
MVYDKPLKLPHVLRWDWGISDGRYALTHDAPETVSRSVGFCNSSNAL